MVVFANVIALTTVRRLILEARSHAMRPHYDLTLTMAAIVGVLAFGVHIAQNRSPTKPLRVAAVQAGIPQRQKFDPQFAQEIFGKFTHLSEIALRDRKSTRLNSSHQIISYAVFCLKKKSTGKGQTSVAPFESPDNGVTSPHAREIRCGHHRSFVHSGPSPPGG